MRDINLQAFAETARQDAIDYRARAASAKTDERRDYYLKCAADREGDEAEYLKQIAWAERFSEWMFEPHQMNEAAE